MRKITGLFILFLMACLPIVQEAYAQSFSADQRQSLRGLSSLLLVVEFAEDAVVMDGLNRDDLELELSQRLRSNGVRLINEAQWSRTTGFPYLYVYLNTVRSELGFYSYRIEVKLTQEVILARNRSLSQFSTTWETGSLGLIGVNNIRNIRSEIVDMVNIFIDDFKSVN